VCWPPRLLVLRPDHIGDLLFLLPALAELRSCLPEAHIALAVGPWVAPLARLCPDVDEVATVRFPGFGRRRNANLLAPYALTWRLARSWRGRFDLCLVSRRDHWWGAMTAALAGVPRVFGSRTPETGPFLTRSVEDLATTHEVAANLALVRLAASSLARPCPAEPPTPVSHALRLPLPEAVEQSARQWLERNLGVGDGFVCIHPGAGAVNKVWPATRYQSLVRALADETKRPLLVTGSPVEAELVSLVASATPAALPAPGEFNLPALAAVLGRAALVVGSDSGPLHMAVARGTPTVHVFGPADPARFAPWGPPERHIVLTAKLPCRPCGDLSHCRLAEPLACMKSVSVDQVLAACRSLLAAQA